MPVLADRPAGLTQTPTSVAAGLLEVVGPLRRVLRRQVGSRLALAPLSTAQVELLRVVLDHPGVGVSEAAARLQLAPNTVSTLVNALVGHDLLRRRRDPDDRRGVRLELTGAASSRLERWQRERHRLVGEALARLARDDQVAIGAALPALRRLIGEVEQG